MAKKSDVMKQSVLVNTFNPAECPYKEFKDNELSPEYWGMGPIAFRSTHTICKTSKSMADFIWVDDQAQPLPRSARQYLHSWVRAEELALNRWNAEVVIFEENNGGKMSIMDIQLSHAQVLLRSSFCRRVLSLCFILERVEGLMVEHQWENFTFNMGTEGWRPKYHIYSPGLKPGGGPQHRPTLSKNGCYLVRLFYLGAWRCVWISDQVPVDATDSPLLPFSPLLSSCPTKPGAKQVPAVTSNVVHLWPLLICKALLKLAAPDMNDEDTGFEDELLLDFDILHALTGGLNLTYKDRDYEKLWRRLSSEVPAFSWDDDDDTLASTTKSRSTKKPATKETAVVRRSSMTTIKIEDTKSLQPYTLPGISPGHEMDLLVIMFRDLPLKKPLPEPEVPLWKTIRWVEWARHHGLYEAYDCPRTRFLKVNGLLKLSYAPHLLDLQSTESITFRFREENDKTNPPAKKPGKDVNRSTTANSSMGQQAKEELRDWIQYDMMEKLIKNIAILYYPSMYCFTTAASNPPIRITKAPQNKALDILAPKYGPLYLQVDGPDENIIRISLNVINPRVLLNCGVPLVDEIDSVYLVLEVFEWFVDCELPDAKAFLKTKAYDAVEVMLPPGRHFCRVWIHSRTNWYVMLLSESSLLLGTRDLIQCAAVRECPWASIFLLNLGAAFSSWIKVNRSIMNVGATDLEFYRSYQPDLEWNSEIVGYNKNLLHWMFRQALQSLLIKRLPPPEFRAVCVVLRKYLCDPNFGLPPRPASNKPLRGISLMDPCDCVMPEAEETEIYEQHLEEQEEVEEKSPVSHSMMEQLLMPVKSPITSQICELATEELPCGLLKKEREKVIRKHEAATLIQAHWRGAWARKCLNSHVLVAPEVLKVIMENAFGNLEALSALMNEFFRMYPGAKYAYSVASALSGVYGLQQYTGNCCITSKCKWIPYFQGVFNCHTPVQVHLDIQSSVQHSTLAVYNNDTGEEMPQAFNAHITFHFEPNEHGYTITGHGCLNQPQSMSSECHWQLTILSSTASSFHICDNRDPCKEMNLTSANKMHIDEIFIPNRRNILGGILLLVNKHEVVSFRAASMSPELKMVAILKTISNTGETRELATCSGVGELYWPYIRLEPTIVSNAFVNKHSVSHLNLTATVHGSMFTSARSIKGPKQKQSYPGAKSKSSTKLREDKIVQIEPKQYCIEVIAPNGWPLSISQWYRVDEIRNSQESKKLDVPIKKPTKEKGSAKDKDKSVPASIYQPEPGDAYIELECSVSESCSARRDNGREIEFSQALKSWDSNEPGRNLRGAEIRKEFRSEFLETIAVQPSEKSQSLGEELLREETMGEDGKEQPPPLQQGPTPATESGILEMSVESLEEAKFLTMPEQLRDKFIPLYFVPLCTKEYNEDERTILTLKMTETAEVQRQERIKLALERMRQLQEYNEVYVLGRQKRRCRLLENLFVDAQWKPELNSVLEERDDAVAREGLRILSATKKKQEDKKKK